MPDKLKTLDIEIAIMQHYGVRQNIIVPNISWGVDFPIHELDLCILPKSSYAIEVEIKVSKPDLLKDKEKKHGHKSDFIKKLYFAVPKKLEEIALKEIPERAGLFVVSNTERGYFTQVSREAIHNKSAIKWTIEQRQKLSELGTMRILGLKEKLAKGRSK